MLSPVTTVSPIESGDETLQPARPAHRRSVRSSDRWVNYFHTARRPIAVLLATRLVALLVLDLTTRIKPGLSVRSMIQTWDSVWYLQAAQHGWPEKVPFAGGHVAQSTIAFFPAFPLAIRGTAAVTGLSYLDAGYVVELLAQAVMVVLLWKLTERIWDRQAADRATVLFCVFPGAFIFSLLYSEPLFFVFAILCLYALLDGQWLLAGAAAGLGTAVTPNAVVLVVCCGWASGVAIATRREWKSLCAPVLAPAGIVAYLSYLWASTGSVRAWTNTESEAWGQHTHLLALWNLVDFEIHNPGHIDVEVNLIGTAFVIVAFVVLICTRPPEKADQLGWWALLAIFSAGIVLLPVTSPLLGLRPRFVLSAFPLIMVVAYRVKNQGYLLLVGCSAVVMGALLITTVTTTSLIP